MAKSSKTYPARLDIDYPGDLNRLTTFFRLIMVIPILIIQNLLSSGLWLATALMIVFRRKYPRWWFDFARELARLGARIAAYGALAKA